MASVVKPIFAALECTCLQEGEECFEATRFNQAFWHKYWQYTVPWIYKELEGLKASLPAGAASYMAVHAGAKMAAPFQSKSVDVSHEKAEQEELKELETENEEIQRKVWNLQAAMGSRSHSQIRQPPNFFGAHSSGKLAL